MLFWQINESRHDLCVQEVDRNVEGKEVMSSVEIIREDPRLCVAIASQRKRRGILSRYQYSRSPARTGGENTEVRVSALRSIHLKRSSGGESRREGYSGHKYTEANSDVWSGGDSWPTKIIRRHIKRAFASWRSVPRLNHEENKMFVSETKTVVENWDTFKNRTMFKRKSLKNSHCTFVWI